MAADTRLRTCNGPNFDSHTAGRTWSSLLNTWLKLHRTIVHLKWNFKWNCSDIEVKIFSLMIC
ncbi:hypothetical protein V2J09_010097 [Rumex salicifolius]